jgi:AAA domain
MRHRYPNGLVICRRTPQYGYQRTPPIVRLQPRLLVRDPFVRLHRIDETVSGDVAPLLAFLREWQRRHTVAVVHVHHARKGAGTIRAGQALRGSSVPRLAEFQRISAAAATIASALRLASRRRRHAKRHT